MLGCHTLIVECVCFHGVQLSFVRYTKFIEGRLFDWYKTPGRYDWNVLRRGSQTWRWLTFKRTHIIIHTRSHAHIHIHTHTHAHTHTHIHVHTHIHTHTHTRAHTHTHTHTMQFDDRSSTSLTWSVFFNHLLSPQSILSDIIASIQ